MLGCKRSSFPIEQNLKLDPRKKEAPVDDGVYKRLIGQLLYLQAICPDVTYVVNVLSQLDSNHQDSHMQVVTRVLRYLK